MRPSVPLRLAASLALAAPAAARAQSRSISPYCGTAGVLPGATLVQQDACQKSVDVFDFVAPQLGLLVASGAPELGGGSTLGGLGHAALAVRVNGAGGRLPDLTNVRVGVIGAQQADFRTTSQFVALPAADVALGLFGGVPVGLTRVGGVDVLLSAGFVPSLTAGSVRVERTGGGLKFGVGVRLGILEESRFVPGLSVSYLHRALPTASVSGTTADGSRVGVDNATFSAGSWRVAASYRVAILRLSAGVGQDRYSADARLAATVAAPGIGPVQFSQLYGQQLTRTNVHAGAALPLGSGVRLAGEVGRSSGGSLGPTYNTFSGRTPTDAYTYYTLGLHFGR